MIKREELTNLNSCMSRALPDERTFVLLARDEISPKIIREWCRLRCLHGKNTVKDPQIVEALECADLMDIERPFVRLELSGAFAEPSGDPTCCDFHREGGHGNSPCGDRAGTPEFRCATCRDTKQVFNSGPNFSQLTTCPACCGTPAIQKTK